MDVDERTRMEALRNPRARGPADLARTITNARTRAAPPAPPEPQQTVTEADQQDNIAPWQTNDSTSDNMPNATTTNTLSDQQGPLKQGRSAKKTASLTRKKALIESLEQEQSAVEAVSRTKVQISGDVVRDGSSATSSLLRTASNTVRVTAKVSRQLSRKPSTAKSRASFSSSVASKALTSETLPTDGSTGEGESERGSEETGADDGEDDWDHLIASVMGEDEGYGFLPTRSSRRGEETPATALSSNLPGMPDEESQDLHDDSDNDASHLGNTPAATPATAESGGPPREEAYRDTDEKAAGPSGAQPKIKRQMSLEELAEWDPSKDRKTGENGDGKSGDGPNGPSEQKRSEGDLGFLGMLGSAYEGGDGQTLLQKIVRCLALVFLGLRRKWMTNSSGQDKVLVSILITPIKRLERDANKSSKRVHFKLRKATTANKFFRPLQKSSNLKQMWLVGMLLPMSYDIFAFGLRLAFCDMYLRKLLGVWIVDIICDVWKLADIAVSLITIVPKGTYLGQNATASTLRSIAQLYFRHQFVWDVGPMVLYQSCSIAIMNLPQTEFHLERAQTYLWIWFACMTPRFIIHVLRVKRYADESIVDPKITRNIKQFQLVYIIFLIAIFAHLIGCFYYFLARLLNFNETTWISAFEEKLPSYEYPDSTDGLEYLLILFKGFNRISSLGYDPGLPGNMPEMALAMLVMLLSVYISSLILGTLLTYLVRRDPVEVEYRQRVEGLSQYMQRKHLPADLNESVMKFLKFQYKKQMTGDSTNGSDLFKALSVSLRIEVANAYHRNLIDRCAKIGRPFHRCMVHKDDIPRELYFVSSGAVQVVDEHDQVVSVIRSDVPDTAPVVGEVPFFLGINYLKAMKASLDGDVHLQVLSKDAMTGLKKIYPDDHNMVCQNLWSQYDSGRGMEGDDDDLNLDQEKLLTKRRILDSTNFRKEQQFLTLCKAARSGDVDIVAMLARQGANLNQTDYDGRTAMHMACSGGRYKVVEVLLKEGAAADIKDRWGQTPMGIAIAAKQQMIITVLASSGKAKLDMASPELALCSAAGAGDLQQVKRLVDFGVKPNLGDYDRRTALHVSAAEGHEKIVEFLLLSQADPNCKDRWGGTPLQDALTGGHIGTAHLLKAKGAAVPDSFGAEAVCTAAGKGDVPKLRMLHSFGQSLDVGDYDDRNALHLAAAEGRVLAVSFLLGISSDPNRPDRWSGTPMDDCVRGGTLYHKYCAKLLQGWGGELGTFKDSEQGDEFLTSLEVISIKSIREVIRRLIDQGMDKVCPERMDDQQLIVCLTATVRHMPLVTQLHRNTSIITKEMRHFRHIVHTFVNQVHSNVVSVLEILLKGTRRVPELDTNITDDLKPPPRRPKTAIFFAAKTRHELSQELDLFNGIEQLDNTRVLDSLLLESPAVSHKTVGPPLRIARQLQRRRKQTGQTESNHDQIEGRLDRITPQRTPSFEADLEALRSNADKPSDFEQLHAQLKRQPTVTRPISPTFSDQGSFKQKARSGWVARELQSRTMANLAKRNSQRSDALLKTLFDSTITPTIIREFSRMVRKKDKHEFQRMTEMTEGMIDSDLEEELHQEIDSITATVDDIEKKRDGWWEKQGARMFNQLALHIVAVESAFKILHQIMCTSLARGQRHEADPLISAEHLARAFVTMQVTTRHLDLDKIVENVHHYMKPFRLLVSPKERRENKDKPSGLLRFSTMISASTVFRNAILKMDVDEILCKLMKSKMSEFINEELGRLLLAHARLEMKDAGDLLHNDGNVSEHRYLTLVLSGDVSVTRTLDDVEIGRGKCAVGCYFGAFKALQLLDGIVIPEEQQEVAFKEGGSGINNCIFKSSGRCEIIRMHINDVHEVVSLMKDADRDLFYSKLVEKLAADLSNLENLNALVMEKSASAESFFHKPLVTAEAPEWIKDPQRRKYYSLVPELDRKAIKDSFTSIQSLWRHLSRGAKTVPKGTVNQIREFLGESGTQCFSNVFLPMEEPTAPTFFDEETFWFCWVHFLAKSIKHAIEHDEDEYAQSIGNAKADREGSDSEDEEQKEQTKGYDSFGAWNKGVVTITVKTATKLSPMDTFSGKADPYLLVAVDEMSQKTAVKAGTLEPTWEESMQFNAIANRSIIRVEAFDAESMGQDRTMGSFSIFVPPNPSPTNFSHKLSGRLGDGRLAQGTVHLSICFVQGAKKTKTQEQKTEFQVFCETENIKDWILWWLLPSRRIEKAFFGAHLPVHEREFTKAVGALATPLTGLAIKQYLTYLLVEHSHQVDVYTCREFVGFFKRKLDDETSIAYRDIVRVVKERNSGLRNNDLLVANTMVLNPHHWLMHGWDFLVRLVALYHMIMVPVRIGFNPSPSLSSRLALSTDLPADCVICLHMLLLLNIAYKNSKSQWVTSRFRIFKNMDWILVLAVIPIEWIVHLSGMEAEHAVWFRVNKFLLYFSRASPSAIIYSTRGGSILDLMAIFLIICHICACIFYYIGTKVPDWELGKMNQVSWLRADAGIGLDTYDREEHFAMRPEASGIERYILSLFWVFSTITCEGTVGNLEPQNFVEIVYCVVLLGFNLTIYRWISGEIANMVMNADDKVIRTREEHEKILKFISAGVFSSDLRERIQSHLQLASKGNVSEEQDRLLMSLSHGLRVEIARYIWREFITKVHLFRGCSGQFLDAVCVLVYEKHFGPEESIGMCDEISEDLFILVHGGFELISAETSRVKKVHRRGQCVGILSVFFGVKQYFSTRASRMGAVCVRLEGTALSEVMQIYPKDEERVRTNVLNFYSKDKSSTDDADKAFSVHSDGSDDSGHASESSRATANTYDSRNSRSSRNSAKTGTTSGSKRSSTSRGSHDYSVFSHGSRNSKSSNGSKRRRAAKKQSTLVEGESEAGMAMSVNVSDAGSTAHSGPETGVDDVPVNPVGEAEEEEKLTREQDHIPLIKERLLEDKISHILTVSAAGDINAVRAALEDGEIQLSCKDAMGRTPMHVAASEGHTKLVEFLLEQKADPAAKDKFHNTPFNDAVRCKHDVVAAMMRRLDPNITFKLGGNELGVLMCQAAFDARLDDIKRLVNNGVDPNEDDYDGRTGMHLAASEGHMEVLQYLLSIKANIMCRDRFNGTPLEDAVRHHFETRNADAVQKLLRDHGATLAGEGLNYVVKMCEYAAQGSTEHIRLLATNGVDVSMGDYDDRTPLHLASCCGNTAVLEYLLKQDTVLVNAVDRFGGTPYADAIRHDRKGAAALLEEAGCVRPGDGESEEVIQKMIERANMRKEERLRKEREPKINHVLSNSQESKMVATISDKLSKEIADQSAQIELISQRLIWALRGFGDRLHRNNCNIPFTDPTFVKSTEHVIKLVGEMRNQVNISRIKLMSEVQGDAGASDCLIWRNASKEYKREARELDDQMRELILLSKVTKRMLKEVINVCRRGARQDMYAESASSMRQILQGALISRTSSKDDIEMFRKKLHKQGGSSPVTRKKSVSWGRGADSPDGKWAGLRQVVNLGSKLGNFLKRKDSNVEWSEHGGSRTDVLASGSNRALLSQHKDSAQKVSR